MNTLFQKYFTILLCLVLTVTGCSSSVQTETLVSSIYQGNKFDFRHIPRLSPFEEVLKREGLSSADVISLSSDRFQRNEKLKFSDISVPCKVLYILISETDDRLWGGNYFFEPINEQEYQSLCLELYKLLSALPEPTMGKVDPLKDSKENINVVWEGVDRSRFQVTTGTYADTGSYYIDLAIRPIYVDHSRQAKDQT